jgi:hypothetical protein
MSQLTQEDIHERLRLDYRVIMKMRSPLVSIRAYRNADDLRSRLQPIVSEDEGHLAAYYLADYHIRTLIGPDQFSDKTSVLFDLLANNNYPFSEPSCWVTSIPVPWSPFFKEGYPICIGGMWHEAKGAMLLGQLIVHIAKLLNFDDISRSESYGGYHAEAVNYWRTNLGHQPITPNLPYPVLPDSVPGSINDFFNPKLHSLVDHIFKPRRTNESRRFLRVFLCHSHADKQIVHDLYHRLLGEGYDPWLDEEKLLPGQDWQHEISQAVRNTDVVIVCLSRGAITKRGFVHNEIKQALDVADEQPEGTIFLIPLMLERCDIPKRLSRWHCVNLSEDKGYEKLVSALKFRASTVDFNVSEGE